MKVYATFSQEVYIEPVQVIQKLIKKVVMSKITNYCNGYGYVVVAELITKI